MQNSLVFPQHKGVFFLPSNQNHTQIKVLYKIRGDDNGYDVEY